MLIKQIGKVAHPYIKLLKEDILILSEFYLKIKHPQTTKMIKKKQLFTVRRKQAMLILQKHW